MDNLICPRTIDIKTYNIFPVDESCGWIEMVEKSSTLYDIKHKYKTSLQNYILDMNPNITIKEMRKNFINTCVSSCVLCYVISCVTVVRFRASAIRAAPHSADERGARQTKRNGKGAKPTVIIIN